MELGGYGKTSFVETDDLHHKSCPANEWLRSELARRQAQNPRYSLRAFAKLVGVSPGRMSEWLSNRRDLSHKSVSKVAEQLEYSPDQIHGLVKSLFDRDALQASTRTAPRWAHLLEEQIASIEDPIHDVLFEFVKTSGFKKDLTWIAQRLKKSVVQVQAGFERLERVGLIERTTSGAYVPVQTAFQTTTDVPSSSLRAHHRAKLLDAVRALDEVPLQERDVTSVTFRIDPKKIPLAKEMIRDFRRNLAALLSAGKTSEVYELNIQLLPKTFHCNEIVKKEPKNKGKMKS